MGNLGLRDLGEPPSRILGQPGRANRQTHSLGIPHRTIKGSSAAPGGVPRCRVPAPPSPNHNPKTPKIMSKIEPGPKNKPGNASSTIFHAKKSGLRKILKCDLIKITSPDLRATNSHDKAKKYPTF